MSSPTPPPAYQPVPTGETIERKPSNLGRLSLVLAIVAGALRILSQAILQFLVISTYDTASYGVLSAVATLITSLIAVAALVVGFIALSRGASNRASAGAGVGIASFMVLQTIAFLPLSVL